MSRLGKRPIDLPDDVEVKVNNGEVIVSGPEGELSQQISPGITLDVNSDTVQVKRRDDSKQQKSYHGLMWSLINNMIDGVTKKFAKTLVLNGLGYRAQLRGDLIHMELGFSNPVQVDIPDHIEVEIPNRTTIKVTGIDKQKVGQFAAQLRYLRDPDPYNQKGIKYEDEHIRQKVGKTVGGEEALGE